MKIKIEDSPGVVTEHEVNDIDEVDLDETPATYDGQPLDEAGAAALGDQIVAARRVGRPSLSGRRGVTPQLGARVAPEVRERLQARADREGKRLSDVVREALEAYAG